MRKKIRSIRIQKNISISILANKLKISESMIRKVESGLRTPSATLAKKWANYLEVPDEKIFKYFFNPKPDNMCKTKKSA